VLALANRRPCTTAGVTGKPGDVAHAGFAGFGFVARQDDCAVTGNE
jgi:hypothetical protein